MNTTTVGVDLAKLIFAICMLDGNGRVLLRRELRREAFAAWLAQLPAGTIVAMEACSGAHHWARRCLELGLQPRVIAGQFVTPVRKSRRSKNDRNDGSDRHRGTPGNMRFVRSRRSISKAVPAPGAEGYKEENLKVTNRIRGLLAGGVVLANRTSLRRALVESSSARTPRSAEFCASIGSKSRCACGCVISALKHMPMATNAAVACASSLAWVRSPPMPSWPASAMAATLNTDGRCPRGLAWCRNRIPVADINAWVPSVAAAMRTCARY